MSEEIKNKAEELTDEEMGKVSGGRCSFLCVLKPKCQSLYICKCESCTDGNFAQNYIHANTCQFYEAFNINNVQACQNCRYFEPLGNYDESRGAALTNSYREKNWDCDIIIGN